MKKSDPLAESSRWWRQAEADYKTAATLWDAEDFSPCAFHAQQAAEKALKAWLYSKGIKAFGHSLVALLASADEESLAEVDESIDEAASALDKHYISTRYPDAFEDQIPAEFYTAELAEEALTWSKQLMQFVGKKLPYLKSDSDDTPH
jgi:HEPN domain-containing protein